jgi:hypothetical protein
VCLPAVRPESASVDPVGRGFVLYAVDEESECMLETDHQQDL